MPDYISRKKLKKKVLDRWENEGGMVCIDSKNSRGNNPLPKRKRKKDRLRSPLQPP